MTIAKTIAKRVLTALNHMIPKGNIILLGSFPPFRDNAFALYQYILHNRKDIISHYQIYWAQENVPQEVVNIYVKSGNYIDKNSPKGIWLFLRARYVISTHGFFTDVYPGRGQLQINLWHGNGYKVIPPRDRVYRGDFSIGTSMLFLPIIAEKFEISPDNVWITGLPRNDNLFHPGGELMKLAKGKTYKRTILWMPTYRKALFNHTGVDGNTDVFGLKTFLENDLYEFDKWLSEKNIILLIKPHPMDELSEAKVESTNNIVFFTNQTVEDLHIDLYSLLAETDALISDYSSVVVDYLLTDKPIGIVCADLEEYKSNRGFVLNPVQDYLPGPIIQSRVELKQFIVSIDEESEIMKQKRLYLKNLFHKYQDDHSSERVCNMIFGEIN